MNQAAEATWAAQDGIVESGTVRPEGVHRFASGDQNPGQFATVDHVVPLAAGGAPFDIANTGWIAVRARCSGYHHGW